MIFNFFVNWENVETSVYDQHSKVSILSLWMNWGKLFTNLSFTIDNRIGNLHEAAHISNFCTNVKNLSMNWIICFWLRKVSFWYHWKYWTYHKGFGWRKGPAETATPLSAMLISTENITIDKYRKRVATGKSSLFKKWSWSFEMLNLTFYAK